MQEEIKVVNAPKVLIKKCQKPDRVTRIDNDAIEDSRLSIECLSILVYLLKKPEDWIVSIKNICNRFERGETAVRSYVNKLIELGYLFRYPVRDKGGKIACWIIEVSDDPNYLKESLITRGINPELKKKNRVNVPDGGIHQLAPDGGKPDSGNPPSGHLLDTKKDLTNKTNNNLVPSNPREALSNGDVVVFNLLTEIGISESEARSNLKRFGRERCMEVLEHVKNRQDSIKSLGGYALKLLETNASLSSKLSGSTPNSSRLEETKELISKMEGYKPSTKIPEEAKKVLDTFLRRGGSLGSMAHANA